MKFGIRYDVTKREFSIVEVNMPYTYTQSTGQFCNDKSSVCKPSYSGYMGEKDQTKKDRGPIPEGKYTGWLKSFESKNERMCIF